jgi:transcriptional regulator with XRE-family HTH domain
MTVQERIKQLMNDKGWSEYKLAKEAQLSQSTVTKIFDRNNAPTLPTIEAICGAFNMTISQFFADDGEPITLTPEQKAHLELWGSLDDKQRQKLDEFLKTI